jgi:hypothetical protein
MDWVSLNSSYHRKQEKSARHKNSSNQPAAASLAWLELDADAVHAVALISGCREAFTLEHVT